VAPAYPEALRAEGPKGSADVEFIIDRDGRIRWPRVVKTTHPEFGQAALVAINQWVFDLPTRSGQPADVRVRIPFQFAP
jgi:TonB family protein